MTSVSFKSLIDEALEINNLSINRLATLIGVDRPWLQHALVGRRPLGYDNFEKIMNSLCLSEYMKTELREAFAKEYFGDTNFKIIKNGLSKLHKMAEFEGLSTPPPEFSDNSANPLWERVSKQYPVSEKQAKFLSDLQNIIEHELKKDTPVFYTNYALSIDCVRMLFLCVLREAASPVDYRHIVFKEPGQSEQLTLNNFFYQYEFAGYGYNTYYARTGKGLASASPLPYFVLTSDTVIFFSENLELNILENDSERISYMHDFFMKTLSSSVPFCIFMRSKDDYALFTSLLPQNAENIPTHYYDLSSNLCMASFLDEDILADSIPDEIEHKDYFVQGMAGFFSFYCAIPHTAIFSNDSLMSFVENDTEFCDYHNVTFDVFRISPENKLKMLKKLKLVHSENIEDAFIPIPNKLMMPSFFHVNVFSSCLILGYNFKIFDINDGNRYIATVVNQDPVLCKHLNNISEYITHSSCVYSNSRNYAISQIDNAIGYYCKKHGFEDNM